MSVYLLHEVRTAKTCLQRINYSIPDVESFLALELTGVLVHSAVVVQDVDEFKTMLLAKVEIIRIVSRS
jgi:hypothetical protein